MDPAAFRRCRPYRAEDGRPVHVGQRLLHDRRRGLHREETGQPVPLAVRLPRGPPLDLDVQQRVTAVEDRLPHFREVVREVGHRVPDRVPQVLLDGLAVDLREPLVHPQVPAFRVQDGQADLCRVIDRLDLCQLGTGHALLCLHVRLDALEVADVRHQDIEAVDISVYIIRHELHQDREGRPVAPRQSVFKSLGFAFEGCLNMGVLDREGFGTDNLPCKPAFHESWFEAQPVVISEVGEAIAQVSIDQGDARGNIFRD